MYAKRRTEAAPAITMQSSATHENEFVPETWLDVPVILNCCLAPSSFFHKSFLVVSDMKGDRVSIAADVIEADQTHRRLFLARRQAWQATD